MMRYASCLSLFCTAMFLPANDAAGHFLWLDVQPLPDAAQEVRVWFSDGPRPGSKELEAFQQTWHYCTASFDVPGPEQPVAKEPPALETLLRARERRAVWKDFPGLTADVTVFDAGQQRAGKLSIDASGSVELVMPTFAGTKWAEDQLESMVQHRMPDSQVAEGKVTYRPSRSCAPR